MKYAILQFWMGERYDILYFDSGASICSDIFVALGVDTYVGDAECCGEQFAAADSTINHSFERLGSPLMGAYSQAGFQ